MKYVDSCDLDRFPAYPTFSLQPLRSPLAFHLSPMTAQTPSLDRSLNESLPGRKIYWVEVIGRLWISRERYAARAEHILYLGLIISVFGIRAKG